jgi:acylphosphatase
VKRAHVRIRGDVQGVGFRYGARSRARSLELSGWVHNARDGSVEAVFEGNPSLVDRMVEWCRRGPGGAQVESVEVSWEEPLGDHGFDVR